jgi:cob(I)alamin adenosyltransferase
MNDIFKQLQEIKKDLDKIDMELAMNQEAMQSLEMEIRFLEAEIDYFFDDV